jgi:hypothetical protein
MKLSRLQILFNKMSIEPIRKNKWLMIVIIVTLMLILSISYASASLVEPEPCDEGNPPLTEGGVRIDNPMGVTAGVWTTYYYDDVEELVEPVPDDFWIKIIWYDTSMGPVLDFESNYPIDKIVVKGGTAANCYNYYDYPEPVYADTGIHSPVNPANNKYYATSHIDFYFGEVRLGKLKIVKIFTGYSDVVGFVDTDMLPLSIQVNIKGKTTGLSYDMTTGETITINRTGTTGNYKYEWTSAPLIPGTYIFSEVSVPGWTPSYDPTSRELVVVAGAEPAAGAIGTITNTFKPGALKLEKAWVYAGVVGFDPATMLPASIDVIVTGPSYPTGHTFTLLKTADYKMTLTGLIPGDYVMTEINSGANWAVTYVPTNRTQTVVAGVAEADALLIKAVNTFKPGALKLEKAWVYAGVVGFDPATMLPASIDVIVTGPSYPTGHTFTLLKTADYKMTLTGLIPGDYVMTEINSGANWAVTYVPTNRTQTVVAGVAEADALLIKAVNTFKPGALKLEKAWVYAGVVGFDPATMLPASIDVIVTGPSYPTGHTFTLLKTADYKMTLTGLIPGDYVMTEINSGTNWAVTYVPTNRTQTVVAGVAEADALLIKAVNTFKPGALKLEKAWVYAGVVGFDPATMLPASIDVIVTGPSYPTGHTFTLLKTADYKMTLTGLIPGDYVMTEINSGANWAVTYVPTNRTQTVVAGVAEADALLIKAVNTFKPGALKLEKAWVYAGVVGFDPATMLPASIDVIVTGPSYPTGHTFTLLKTADYKMTLTGLIPGDYVMTEINSGANWAVTYVPTNRTQTVVAGVAEADALLIKAVNTFKPGCLKLEKVWNWGGVEGWFEESMIPDSIEVVVTGPSYPTGHTFTLLKTEFFKMTLCNLIPGTYTISEITYLPWIVSYDPISRSVVVAPGTTEADALTLKVINTIRYHDETAWAYGGQGTATSFLDLMGKKSQNWGWTNHVGSTNPYTASWELIAGAGRSIYLNGEFVGYLDVARSGSTLTITYRTTIPDVLLCDTHLWVGTTKLPIVRGKYISSPGQLEQYMTYAFSKNRIDPYTVQYVVTVPSGADIWIAAHADVRIIG